MSDTNMSIPSGRVQRPKKRPNITIDGNQWMPLENFAARIGCSLAEADRLNFPSVEIGGALHLGHVAGAGLPMPDRCFGGPARIR